MLVGVSGTECYIKADQEAGGTRLDVVPAYHLQSSIYSDLLL